MTAKTGIETEESLLNESAARETSLYSQIIDLENEVKQLRHELERVTAERDRTLQENNDIGKDKEDRNMECKKLRTELREIKFRETRLLTDYSELEEENIALQKQVSILKSTQVEFESLKHEIRRLQEEMDILNGQVEELSNLKKIAEKHMEEALEALQSEREAKYALKKELDQHVNRESFYNISNLAYSIRNMSDDQSNLGSDVEDDMKRIETTLNERQTETNDDPNKHVDLFSEVHLNELRKLEKQLEQLEKEKVTLQQNLRDNQCLIERSHGELQSFLARLSQLGAHVDSLQHLHQNVEKAELDAYVNEKSSRTIDEYKKWSKLSIREIEQLKNDIRDMEKIANVSDATVQLRNEITNLKNRILDADKRSLDLENDLKLIKDFAVEAGVTVEDAQNNLQTVTEDLAQLYHHLCTVNGRTPNRVMLEHERHVIDKENDEDVHVDKIERLRNNLKNDLVINDLECLNDTMLIAKHASTIIDQIKHLKNAIECTIELSKCKGPKNEINYDCKYLNLSIIPSNCSLNGVQTTPIAP